MHISRHTQTSHLRLVAATCAVALLGGCMMQSQSAPAVTGPSGPGLSLSMQARPSALPRDGSSQSTITVVARDESGGAVPGVRLLASVSPGATPLAQSEAVTGSDGSATFVLTAPTLSTVAANNQVVLWITPLAGINDDIRNASARSVALGLLGPSNATYPSANFVTSPTAPKAGDTVVFDASSTTDEGVPCLSCAYEWDVAGSAGSGRFTAFQFLAAGSYYATLTVTDVTGTTSSVTKAVTVADADAAEEMP